MRQLSLVAAGGLFGAGLVISGMTNPGKVIGFLDILGDWDPSLALVMLGAISIHAVSYLLIRGRRAPLAAELFHVPTRRDIDGRLVGGAALFGVGWGIAGYCPGPAISSLVTLRFDVAVFVGTMLIAMMLHHWIEGRS